MPVAEPVRRPKADDAKRLKDLEQLQFGLDVIVECVNPVAATRDAWPGTAAAAGAALVEVEVTCSEEAEHLPRVETRASDVKGLVKPTWPEVVERK